MADSNDEQISDVFREMEIASNGENLGKPDVDPADLNPGESFNVPIKESQDSIENITDPFKTDYQSNTSDVNPEGEQHKVQVKEEIYNDSQTTSPDEVENEENGPEPFQSEKQDPSDFEEKEPVLNLDKDKIKMIVISVFILIVIAIIFIPEFQKSFTKKKAAESKPRAEQSFSLDELDRGQYAQVTNEQPESVPEPEPEPEPNKFSQEPVTPPVKSTSSGGLVEMPDTRWDGLQEKNIPGIKGLTSSRTNFATDYEKTVVYNSEKAEEELNPYRNYLPSKDEYTNKTLASVNNMGNTYRNQNDQAGKEAFHLKNSELAGQGEFLGLNTLWEGSIFEAELLTAINTDLPGECTAVITKNIYSSQNGKYLLIPQNSRLIGTYNSSISYAQSRVQVAWTTIIRPDGYKINIGNFNATDSYGMAGLKGMINDHPMQYLKAIGIMGAFSALNIELTTQAGKYMGNQYVQDILADSIQVSNTLGNKLIDRAMDVQPNITIKFGTVIKIFVNQTLSLPPVEQYPVTEKYRR